MSDLYECCDHCLLFRGVCPDREENGGHMTPCPEGCNKGTKVISS